LTLGAFSDRKSEDLFVVDKGEERAEEKGEEELPTRLRRRKELQVNNAS